jgi:peroxiredoxin-like protein
MSRAKEFRFPVAVEWKGGPLTVATVDGKPDLRVATPPEFGSEIEGTWSPEDLLVGAAATCYAVTLSAIAKHRDIPLASMHVNGVGHLSKRDDGRFGFTSVELLVDVEARTVESLAVVEEAVERAERQCLVSMALSVPVNVSATMRVAAPYVTAGT